MRKRAQRHVELACETHVGVVLCVDAVRSAIAILMPTENAARLSLLVHSSLTPLRRRFEQQAPAAGAFYA